MREKAVEVGPFQTVECGPITRVVDFQKLAMPIFFHILKDKNTVRLCFPSTVYHINMMHFLPNITIWGSIHTIITFLKSHSDSLVLGT